MMPAYGYQRRVVDPEWGLLELREVSFKLSPDGPRQVAAFLYHRADRADAGDFRSDHVHIEEFNNACKRENLERDIIVPSP